MLAQTSNGTIAGVVYDPQGAVVTGATVTATSQTTGETRSATTNSFGAYRIESVGPGTYTISVKAPNFALLKLDNVIVKASVITTANANLKVGATETTVEVTVGAETLQTEDGALSHDISHVEITQIPIASLNPLALILTEPGVVAPTSREDFTNGIGFSVNGTRPRANNFLIEGQDNNDAAIQGQALQVINLEATQEVIVQTNSYNAEFGHGGGSVSNLIYKSGTNTWHGSAFDLLQNSALDSAAAEDKLNGIPKASTRENTFGFTVGGPIKTNKMFVFGSIQWDKLRQAANGTNLVAPDAAGIAVLQGLSNPRAAQYLAALGGVVGNTGGPGSGAFVLGNGRPSVTFGRVERSGVAEPANDTQYVAKGDWLATSNDSLTLRYVLDRNVLTPDFFNFPNLLPCCDTQQGGSAHNAGIAYTHTFSPKVINEFRMSYGRIGFTFGPTPASLANVAANGPTIAISGLTGFGTPTGIPQSRFHNTFQYQDSVSWIKGKHSLKFGTDLARILVVDGIPFNNRGTLAYGSTAGFSGLANFIDDFGGSSTTAAAIAFGSPIIRPRYFFQNYFAQDTWKVRPNLTLTVGLRFENAGTPGNSMPFPAVDPVQGAADPNFFTTPIKQKNDNNNFAPRASFAYTPHFWESLLGHDKTVIRGGFGMFYDNLFTNIVDNSAASSPNAISASLRSANNATTPRGLPNLSGRLAALAPVINPAASVTSIVSNLVAPLTYQWNFDVERELPGKFVLTTSYVGTRGLRLFANDQFNPVDPNTGLRVNPTRGSWVIRDNSADSIYHGLDVKLDRRFIHGLLLRTSYTFSKLIDDGSEVFTTTGTSSFPADLTLGHRGIDRGLSAFDHRNRIVVLYVYDIPKLKTADSNFAVKALGALVNGWQTSGSFAYQSGAPETVTDGFDANGDGQANDRPLLSNPSAPLLAFGVDPALFGLAGLSPTGLCEGAVFLNGSGNCNPVTANAVRWIIPANGVGNVGRNTQVAPGRQDTTFAVQRSVNLHSERHQLIFRTEMLNPFNHPNTVNADFNLIGITPNASDVVVPGDQTFGNYPLTVTGSRTVRFWLKYVF
ncbi:MAG TPA: TonB-dependent receptor [Candidatus Angelobacter sp.]